jgi:HEAT repeat protein
VSLFLPPLRPKLEAAIRDVASKDPRSRGAAAEALGDAKDDDRSRARDALMTLASDTEADVRFAALAGLGRIGDGAALEAVLSRFDDEHPMVREVAVIAAAQLRDARALPRIRRALHDAHAQVRFQAVISLVELEGEDARVALFPALADDDAHVRANAAAALATLDADGPTADRLAKLLRDPEANVRLEAALALAKYRDARAAKELARHLDHDRAFEAIEAIAALGARDRADDLAKVARAFLKPLELKAAAAAALARLGDPRGAAVLRDIVRAFRSDGRTYVAEAIGMLGLVELSDELVLLAERPRGADLGVVLDSLAKLLPRDPGLRDAIARLGQRQDAIGERARAILAG